MIPAEIAALTKSVRLTGQLTQRFKLSNNNINNNDTSIKIILIIAVNILLKIVNPVI